MLLIATLAAAPAGVRAQEEPFRTTTREVDYSEDEIKAAFLYNFVSYVQWPVAARSSDTISIAVLGAAAVADALERIVRGGTIQGETLRVRRLRAIGDLDGDEVLFIGPAENGRLPHLIAAASRGSTLIVTDAPDGLAEGAMINFRLVDRRVRFEVSVPRAQEAGLLLSSRLLSAALRVETTHRGFEQREPTTLAGAFRGIMSLVEAPAPISACGPGPGRCLNRI
jgi:hypothetical protein